MFDPVQPARGSTADGRPDPVVHDRAMAALVAGRTRYPSVRRDLPVAGDASAEQPGGLGDRPILLAVHDQRGELETVQHELTSRYGLHYQVICEQSPGSALHRLQVLADTADTQVLMLFAAQQMAAITGIDFLQRAHTLHPHAQRVLLIPWGNRSTPNRS